MRVISSCLIATLLVGLAASPAAAASDPVRLDVGLAVGADPAAVIGQLGDGVTYEQVEGLNAIALDVPADRADSILSTLKSTADVRYAEAGALVRADSSNTSAAFTSAEIPAAQGWTTGSSDVVVAVVDTGVTANVDLPADRLTDGYDFVDGDADATDLNGHGTAIANVIAGDGENTTGPGGVSEKSRIMPVRVLTDRQNLYAEGTTADVAAGIVWAADHGARVINASFSTTSESRLLQDAVEHATEKGALVVASAGNTTTTAHRYPAAFPNVLAVGNSTNQAGSGQNSSTDHWVDVTAYSSMVALGKDNANVQVDGTSGSTALVSGIAALGLAIKPSATAAELSTAITDGADVESTQPSYYAPLVNGARVLGLLGAVDEVKPVLTAGGLTEGGLYTEYAYGQTVTPTVSDDRGVDRVEYLVDDTVIAVDRRAPWSVTLGLPVGYNGTVPVTTRVYDYAGNTDESVTVIEADTTAPSGTVVSPVANEIVFGFTVEVRVSSPDTDLVSVTAYGRSPYTGYPLTWDDTAKVWKGPVNYYRASGKGSFEVSLKDKAGHSTSIYRSFRNDDQAPAVTGVIPDFNAKVRGTFTSTVTGVSDMSPVKAELWANGKYIGSDSTAPYSLTVKTGTFSGAMSLQWRVTDKWGQYRQLVPRNITVDNKAPTVSITSAPKNKAKVKGTVKVKVKASDASGIAKVQLLVNGKVVATDTTSAYVLSVNTKKQKKTMKVQVRAYDKLGNVKYTTTRTWKRK
ncbi:S8 family serine peptidase [Actinoplanes sp. NPDC051851]|uniref:S8 family serine peptidase n=1 Tax=Actinoplanes sp. NPDC051851 TaxID=3154753 RepID=UPI003426ADF6